MTREMFTIYILNIDNLLEIHILLILDNFSAHILDYRIKLKKINIIIFL